jgi:hypothetical protein
VQSRLELVFETFLHVRSVTRVVRYLNEHELRLPRGDDGGDIHWRTPALVVRLRGTVGKGMPNPVFLGNQVDRELVQGTEVGKTGGVVFQPRLHGANRGTCRAQRRQGRRHPPAVFQVTLDQFFEKRTAGAGVGGLADGGQARQVLFDLGRLALVPGLVKLAE